MPIYLTEKGLNKTKRRTVKSHMPKDRRQLELLLEKTQRMICAECLKDRHAHWEIRFFGVNKGKFDIRIACHGSGNGTNLVALSPSFFLPNTLT